MQNRQEPLAKGLFLSHNTGMDLQTLRTQYRSAIIQLADQYKLENVRVFGSTVRGEQREDSDLDILVHPKKGCSLLDISGFEIDLSNLLDGQKVDVVEDEAVHERLAPFIFAEAVPL
jgi:uncharacterized protein